jgi:deoxyribonuclease-1
MMLTKHIKSVIVFSFLFSFGAAQASTTTQIAYYGEAFYQSMNNGTTNEDMLLVIKTVLRSYHVPHEGGLDTLAKACDGAKGCYYHQAVGYDMARVYLLGEYYLVDHGGHDFGIRDMYCGVERTSSEFGANPPGPKIIPDHAIVNTEHTWPQSRFSGRFGKDFQKSDMHHLYPTDSQLNGIRGNNPFGEVVKDLKKLKCNGVSRYGQATTGRAEVFEPPKEHKGNVARALFYFSTRYDLPIDPNQEAVLRKWNKEDPVDQDEMTRNEFILSKQGNRNPFVDYPELADTIADF